MNLRDMSFWLQAWPVTKYALQQEDGAIDPPKTVQDVRPEPYPLPDRFLCSLCPAQCLAPSVPVYKATADSSRCLCSFIWCECDINNNEVVKEVDDTYTYTCTSDN